MNIVPRLKTTLRKYFSGKLVVVQLAAGVGAFAGRSAAVLLVSHQPVWNIVLASMLGSYIGYIGVYALGYWLTFRRHYRASGRFMITDIAGLQLVEQVPNIGTVVASGLMQGALIGGTGLPPVLAANLASWFGLHKIANLVAMAASNSLKRAWVDGSWRPLTVLHEMIHGVVRISTNLHMPRRKRRSAA